MQNVAADLISEPSQFGTRLRTLHVTGVALEPSRFEATVSCAEFGDIAVEIVRTSPALLIERVTAGRAGCLLTLEGAEGAKWDGKCVDRFDVAVLGADTTLVANFPTALTSAFVSTSQDDAETILGAWGWAKEGRGAVSVQRAPRPAHTRLAACVREIERVVGCAPDVLRDDRSRAAMRASLVDAMRSLRKPSEEAKPDKNRATRRHRIVRLTDEYLCANPIRAVYTDDLCQALGVSASALHKAFQDVFGISPHRYLKLRRMSLVRAALLSRSGPWRSVKAAALSYGFWHLGQFAQDYRETYGELPSATLARSGGGSE